MQKCFSKKWNQFSVALLHSHPSSVLSHRNWETPKVEHSFSGFYETFAAHIRMSIILHIYQGWVDPAARPAADWPGGG